MSEETQIQQQEPDTPTQSYISRVRLKGYKSIIDTEVTFKPGLNIIIGANGSGKTNFVEFLANSPYVTFFKSAHKVEVEGFLLGNKKFLYKREVSNKTISKNQEIIQNVIDEYRLDNKTTEKREYNFSASKTHYDVYFGLHLANLIFDFVAYNVPKNIALLDENLLINGTYEDESEFPALSYKNNDTFSVLLNEYIFWVSLKIREEKQISRSSFEIPKNFDYLINNLKKFSPIENVEIYEGFSFNKKDVSRQNRVEFNVDFLKLKFFINKEWIFWNQLSDGTKRMFYIITEVTFSKNIILIEEPELGIHPHQLKRLMDFIIEQSKEKQIIITTHSPEVLNSLGMDELDRIIVAHYDKEKGTQLHHLEEEEMGHARSYMETEGLFLSDYWVYSGFEKEEEEV